MSYVRATREGESSRLVGCSGDKFLSLGESSCPPSLLFHDLLSGQYSPDGHTHGLVVEYMTVNGNFLHAARYEQADLITEF